MNLAVVSRSQELRFQYHHRLEEIYHQILDDLAQARFPESTTGRIAQAVMLSRQEGLKQLIDESEIDAYYETYPQDR